MRSSVLSTLLAAHHLILLLTTCLTLNLILRQLASSVCALVDESVSGCSLHRKSNADVYTVSVSSPCRLLDLR